MLRFVPAVLITAVVCFTACSPRELPGFKREAQRQDERITKETEEAIKKSPALQELDQLCTKEIPRPEGFVPGYKYRDFNSEKTLGYGYQSKLGYQEVKSFYLDYFSQNGWQVTKEKDEGWGQPQIQFQKNSFSVTLYYLGTEGNNYAVSCTRL